MIPIIQNMISNIIFYRNVPIAIIAPVPALIILPALGSVTLVLCFCGGAVVYEWDSAKSAGSGIVDCSVMSWNSTESFWKNPGM